MGLGNGTTSYFIGKTPRGQPKLLKLSSIRGKGTKVKTANMWRKRSSLLGASI